MLQPMRTQGFLQSSRAPSLPLCLAVSPCCTDEQDALLHDAMPPAFVTPPTTPWLLPITEVNEIDNNFSLVESESVWDASTEAVGSSEGVDIVEKDAEKGNEVSKLSSFRQKIKNKMKTLVPEILCEKVGFPPLHC